ncbi:thiol:disulfide interchange protein [Agromyces rhizosphaerae]|uniref:Thiol:disulfide interchange protein n=1 Tax=Agromyces rhizosphaerae TaxID=88374 RepID=A0A9W6CX87_9MICO|nr:redoxin family protein [Agromyces rhizosphaerae]GLI27335.1 thiol:disulfide interchange protein [Agromyces rhizosphaerae]
MRRAIAAAALLVVALTGCAATTAAPEPVTTGEVVDYGFEGVTLDGAAFDGAELQGAPAVLWFWAPWCPTCRAQSGNVSALAEQYAGEVAVVGVGGLDDGPAITEYANGVPHVTHLLDPEGEVWRHFEVARQSTYTVLDADGAIVFEGYLADDALNELVAGLAEG